jgi:hypothetical protein
MEMLENQWVTDRARIRDKGCTKLKICPQPVLMTPVLLKDGRWQLKIPRKLSSSGKRESRYFASKSKALEFVRDFKEERREHGRQAVSADERTLIAATKLELGGDLGRLREVLDHYHRTAHGVTPISARDAVESYLNFRKDTKRQSPATRHDVAWRLHAFAETFSAVQMHAITAGDLERYLGKHPEGWSRKSHHKRLRQFFDHAVRHRWISENPFNRLEPPEIRAAKREVYTPNELRVLLAQAAVSDPEVCLYIALSGLAFLRSTARCSSKLRRESTASAS